MKFVIFRGNVGIYSTSRQGFVVFAARFTVDAHKGLVSSEKHEELLGETF